MVGILLTPAEAAARLRICTKTLRRLRQDGRISYVAVSQRKILYRPGDCDAFVRAAVTSATPVRATHRLNQERSRSASAVVSFTARRQERQAHEQDGGTRGSNRADRLSERLYPPHMRNSRNDGSL